MKKLIGIDPGSTNSGIIVIENGSIRQGYNLPNEEVTPFVQRESHGCDSIKVIVEDVRPYSMRITDGIIQTIKFLGQIEWRLEQICCPFELIPRHQVKQWVFMQFQSIAIPEIEKKIVRTRNRNEKAAKEAEIEFKPRNSVPTFVYVDDRIVANAMRKWWNIQNPSRPGQRAAYGLKDHSWQALGLISYYMALNGLKTAN